MKKHRTRPPISRRVIPILLVMAAVVGLAAAGSSPVAAQAGPLSITKTASAANVPEGGSLTWTITATNTSTDTARNVVVTDSISGLRTSDLVLTASAGTCTNSAGLVRCTAPALSAGQSMTVTIRGTVTAATGTTINNTASVSADIQRQTITRSATASVLVGGGAGPADLVVAITAPSTIANSTAYAYVLTVTNQGGTNASNVRVVNTLPAGVVFNSVVPTNNFTCANVAGTVTCTGGQVSAGANATITINVTSPAVAGSITDTAVVDPLNAIAESNENNNTASAVTQVTAPGPGAGLAVTKTCTPNPVVVGGTLTCTINVVNNTGTQALNVVVVDGTTGLAAASVQAAVVIVPPPNPAPVPPPSCVVNASNVTCSLQGGLAAGQGLTITVSGQVLQTSGATIVNTATASATVGRNNVSNQSTATIQVQGAIDLIISKTASAAPQAGVPFTYTLTINNTGTVNATNVSVVDNLPAGVTFNSAVGNAGFVCAAVGQVVTCNGGTITPATTGTITINVTAASQGAVTNTAIVDQNNAIAETDETNNTATITTTIGTGIDFQITKTDAPDPVAPSGNLQYTITITNAGTENAVGNVLVRDVLPLAVNFISAIPDAVLGAGFNCVEGPAGTVDCVTPDGLNAGETAVIRINVLAPAGPIPTTLTNTVTVDPNNAFVELNESNNTATATTTVNLGGGGGEIDLTITKTDAPDPVAPLGNVTYTLTVTNTGTAVAFNVLVFDHLPANGTFVSASATNGFSCSLNANDHRVECLVGSMNPGGNGVITIVVQAPNAAGTLTNTASVDPNNTIPESAENNNSTGPITTTVTPVLDLSVTKTASNATPAPGSQFNYTVTVTNNTVVAPGATANNVFVRDTLPITGVSVINITSVVSTGGTFACQLFQNPALVVECTGSLPAGANVVITITVEVSANTPNATVLTNSVVVDPANIIAESNEGNNTAFANVTVTNGLNLTITKIQNTAAPNTGGQIVYTVTATANGAAANNVLVRDTLPITGVTLVNVTSTINGGPQSASCQTFNNPALVVECTGNLVAGGAMVITITANVTAAGGTALTNTAVVDPNNTIPETSELDNSASVTATVTNVLDLTITKDQSTATPAPNSTLTYTVTANSTATLPNVLVRDTLPVNGVTLLNVSVATAGWQCITFNNPALLVECNGPITAGVPVVITIQVQVNAAPGSMLFNTAAIDPNNAIAEVNEGNNTDSETATVTAGVDLTIAKFQNAGGGFVQGAVNVAPGGALSYRLDVTSDAAVNGVEVRDALPAGFTVNTIVPQAGSGFSCVQAANVVTCTGGTYAVAGTFTITINGTVTAANGSTLINLATVDPNNTIVESNETNNQSNTVTANVVATLDLTILLQDDVAPGTDPVNAGGPIVYTATVNAVGAGTATNVEARIYLPFSMNVNNITLTAGSSFGCTNSLNVIICTGGTVAAGVPQVITITGTVTTAAGTLNAVAFVDPFNTIPEISEGNNFDFESTTVNTIDLQPTTITPSNAAPAAFTPLSYTYRVVNNGVGTANNVHVRIQLPVGFFIDNVVQPAGWSCANGPFNTVDCTGGTIAGSGGFADITVQGTVGSGVAVGTTFVTTVTADPFNAIPETNEGNNALTNNAVVTT